MSAASQKWPVMPTSLATILDDFMESMENYRRRELMGDPNAESMIAEEARRLANRIKTHREPRR